MRILPADPNRMIDLPGVGPCPRPVDIDRSVTGFMRLVSLRIYRFAPGAVVEGESEADEVFVIAVGGRARVEVTGAHAAEADLGGAHGALYMPPHHAYRLLPQEACVVAYARAEATGEVPSRAIEGAGPGDLAEALRFRWLEVGEGPQDLHGQGETLVHMAGVTGRAVLSRGPDGPSLLDQMADQEGEGMHAHPEVCGDDTLALDAGETVRLHPDGPGRVLVISA